MRRLRSFAGRSVVITGGASGIGLALAGQLVDLGATVTLADIDAEGVLQQAERLTRECRRESVFGRSLDVRDLAAFRALVKEVVDRGGSVDYLFNNAGISMGGPTEEFTAAHWDRIIDVNVRGVVNGVLAAYPGMVERGRGHIVNTASGLGLVGAPFVTAVLGHETRRRRALDGTSCGGVVARRRCQRRLSGVGRHAYSRPAAGRRPPCDAHCFSDSP